MAQIQHGLAARCLAAGFVTVAAFTDDWPQFRKTCVSGAMFCLGIAAGLFWGVL